MATRVYQEEDIVLQDGKEITLRPLPIGPLRRFMEAFDGMKEVKEDDDGLDIFVNCAGIALEKDYKGTFDSLKADDAARKKGQFLSPEYKTHLEDVLDLDTIYKILEVCGGIQLNNPNLVEAAERVTSDQEDGTN